MFLLLIIGYFKVYTIQDNTAQVLKFSNSKVHHFKFILGHFAKSMLAIIPAWGFTFSVILSFILPFVLHFSPLYNDISDMLLSLKL